MPHATSPETTGFGPPDHSPSGSRARARAPRRKKEHDPVPGPQPHDEDPNHPPPASVKLIETLDLKAAVPLAAELAALRGRSLTVDASQVGRVGAQCLQVLLAARTCWRAEGAGFEFVSPSDDFLDSLALMGAASLVSDHKA